MIIKKKMLGMTVLLAAGWLVLAGCASDSVPLGSSYQYMRNSDGVVQRQAAGSQEAAGQYQRGMSADSQTAIHVRNYDYAGR